MEHTTAHVFKCEDTKGVFRSLNSKKDRHDYAKVKKDKKTNNDLQCNTKLKIVKHEPTKNRG